MSMFGPKLGTWSITSEKDKRWNNQGRVKWLCCGGMNDEAVTWVEECEKKFGEKPDDLTYGFFKD